MTHRTYPINTFDEMRAIPAEARPRFLADLGRMLEEANVFHAERTVPGATANYSWCDDGVNETETRINGRPA